MLNLIVNIFEWVDTVIVRFTNGKPLPSHVEYGLWSLVSLLSWCLSDLVIHVLPNKPTGLLFLIAIMAVLLFTTSAVATVGYAFISTFELFKNANKNSKNENVCVRG